MKRILSFVFAIALSVACVNVGAVYQVDGGPSVLCDESYAVTSQ